MKPKKKGRYHAVSQGVGLKKKHGQHFLRSEQVVDHILSAVTLTPQTTVLEIGPGDGFLTKGILQSHCTKLIAYEIDPEWVDHLRSTIKDPRFFVYLDDFCQTRLDILALFAPITIISNIPYCVTWPILRAFIGIKEWIKEGVIMVQEEVAQRIVATSGRSYGYPSLFFQHHFSWQIREKVPPTVFLPPPQVNSRLLYFTPRTPQSIVDEERFWGFIKLCFRQPRRTLRNNLQQTHFPPQLISENLLSLRAQQITMAQFLEIWTQIC